MEELHRKMLSTFGANRHERRKAAALSRRLNRARRKQERTEAAIQAAIRETCRYVPGGRKIIDVSPCFFRYVPSGRKMLHTKQPSSIPLLRAFQDGVLTPEESS